MKPFRLVSYPGTYRELCEPGYEATIIDLWMTSTAGGHADVCCHGSPDLLPNHRSERQQTGCSNLVFWQVSSVDYDYVSLQSLRVWIHKWWQSCVQLCRFGAFFFMAINQVFLNLTALDIFIRQKPLFMYVHACVCTYSGLYIEQIMFLQDSRVWMILKPLFMYVHVCVHTCTVVCI